MSCVEEAVQLNVSLFWGTVVSAIAVFAGARTKSAVRVIVLIAVVACLVAVEGWFWRRYAVRLRDIASTPRTAISGWQLFWTEATSRYEPPPGFELQGNPCTFGARVWLMLTVVPFLVIGFPARRSAPKKQARGTHRPQGWHVELRMVSPKF